MKLKNLKSINLLSIFLSITLTIVSIAGAFFPSTYQREVPSMAAQGAGQDLVDLFLVVPLLLVSLYYTNKGSKIASLFLGGTLAYIMYSFVIYSLGIHFNQMFLLYTTTLGLSLYAFILYMNDMLATDLSEWFEHAPKKLVGIYLIIVAFIFYALWLQSIIPALINKTIPDDVANYDLLVNPVHVIDMAFALPALILGGILIMKGKSTGYLIASLALIFMMILTIALAGMVIMLVIRGISEDYTIATVFGVLTLTSLIIILLLFKRMK
ncbi:MAG: hypothetical protein ACP5E3_05385, partial [Bacteroidales bacterium]